MLVSVPLFFLHVKKFLSLRGRTLDWGRGMGGWVGGGKETAAEREEWR